jgi:hypothetical protein
MEISIVRRIEAPSVNSERRAVLRVLRYWRTICGERDFPGREEIDPAGIAFDWKNCFMVELSGRGGVPSFLHIGEALRIPAWGDGRGARVTDCPPGTVLSLASGYIEKVLESRAPVSQSGSAVHIGRPVLFRSILLPLSSDGARIDALLGTANFRRVDQNRMVVVEAD